MTDLRKAFLGFGMAAAMTTVAFAQETKKPVSAPAKTEKTVPKKTYPDDISGTWSGLVPGVVDVGYGRLDSIQSHMTLALIQTGSGLKADLVFLDDNKYMTRTVHVQMVGTYTKGKFNLKLIEDGLVEEDCKSQSHVNRTVLTQYDHTIEGEVKEENGEVIFDAQRGYATDKAFRVVYSDGLNDKIELGTISDFAWSATPHKGPYPVKFRSGTLDEIKRRDYLKLYPELVSPEDSVAKEVAKPDVKIAKEIVPEEILPVPTAKAELDDAFDAILFQPGNAKFLSADDSLEVVRAAEYLVAHPDAKAIVMGHTERRGTPKALKDLSVDRAEQIEELMAELGVNPKRVETKGVGSTGSVTKDQKIEEDRQKNRNAVIKIIQPN